MCAVTRMKDTNAQVGHLFEKQKLPAHLSVNQAFATPMSKQA